MTPFSTLKSEVRKGAEVGANPHPHHATASPSPPLGGGRGVEVGDSNPRTSNLVPMLRNLWERASAVGVLLSRAQVCGVAT